MVWKTEANFLLTILNIISLSHFEYPPSPWILPIFLLVTQLTWSYDIKKKMMTVSLFSLIASFCVIPWIADFFSVCALGLAMNVGYQIDSPNGPWVINCCLGLGIIIGDIMSIYLKKYQTARDMAILVCTLPNLFMAQDSSQTKQNSSLWFINPFYDKTWTYSAGFIAGVFAPLSTINKHTRFFIISLILLMTIFVKGTVYQSILCMVRGLFIYDQSRHKSQLYFLIGYIIIDLLAPQFNYNYLFVGYLVIGVILWHQQQEGPDRKWKNNMQAPLMAEMISVHPQMDSD